MLQIVIIFYCLIKFNLGCSIFETKRTCQCSYEYTYGNNQVNFKEITFPIDSYDDCATNLQCDKKLSCAKYCKDQINYLLGNDLDRFNQNAKNSLCKIILNNENLNSNGLIFRTLWKYSNCDSGYAEIVSNVCCNPRCKCEIIGQNLLKKIENVYNFTRYLPTKHRAFDCSLNEFNECEKDCRSIVSNELKNQELSQSALNRPIPNYKIFKAFNFASEFMCKEFNQKISKPGLDIYLKIYFDQEEEDENNFKNLPMGRLCCKRKCSCELYSQNASLPGDYLEKSQLLDNLDWLVEKNNRYLSYECFNEEFSCMRECRQAFSEYVQSDLLIRNQTLTTSLTSDLDLTSEKVSGSRLCQILGKEIADPGVNIYLRYSSVDTKKFPYTEELHIGRLCCRPYSGDDLKRDFLVDIYAYNDVECYINEYPVARYCSETGTNTSRSGSLRYVYTAEPLTTTTLTTIATTTFNLFVIYYFMFVLSLKKYNKSK
ncbi:unnamed protein product [Brachionus calyciflorus]|uniref:Uncharacterized protein n=1 Tax=Brachionus calyciflorus TaxID=104777 RepID=A0A813X361_9BILA|nr:unnamed protein product [Brachionus calyciflorus]